MKNSRSKSQWKKEIDIIHEKHLNNIQTEGCGDLAFHYTSPSGLLGMLTSKSVWFSDCDYLNDISESNYFYEISSKSFRSNSKLKVEDNFAFLLYLMAFFHCNDENSNREFLSREGERRYIFSLSIDEDTLPLWNNYTKTVDSTGYNIGFNITKLSKAISLSNSQTLLVGRVIYDREYQKKLLKELFEDYLALYQKYKYTYQRKYLYEAIEDNILVYSVFMKDSAFECEKEFRMAIFEKGEVLSELKYREKNGAFLPYISVPIMLESMVSIMISPTTRADFVKRSVKSMCKYFGIEEIEVKNSDIPLRY